MSVSYTHLLELARTLMPDVIITDINMPVMDGMEFVRKIKEEFPYTYVCILSGYQEFEYAKTAISCGVKDYLLKPINIKQLQDFLKACVDSISKEYEEAFDKIFSAYTADGMANEALVRKYLPYKKYSVALLRKKGRCV